MSSLNDSEMRHIARHDPARVLREVEARGRLLDRYATPESSPDLPDSFNRFTAEITRHLVADVIAHLAAAWSDHPDYQRGWAS